MKNTRCTAFASALLSVSLISSVAAQTGATSQDTLERAAFCVGVLKQSRAMSPHSTANALASCDAWQQWEYQSLEACRAKVNDAEALGWLSSMELAITKRWRRTGRASERIMLEEFKKFVMRGNVVDLAVGIVIGVAFGSIVTSLVGDIIMPIIGAATGGLDFSNYYLPLSSKVQSGIAYADAKKEGAVLGYGQFLTAAVNFLIVAAVLFFVVKAMNRLKKPEAPKAVEVPEDVQLLTQIRDILADKPKRLN